MGLRDELQTVPPPVKGPPCVMGLTISLLDPETRTELDDILADRRVQGSTIAKLLEIRGFAVPESSVCRHRGKRCKCPK